MGDIIRFRPRQGAKPEGSASASAGAGNKGGAQILLFLGVRYERQRDESADPGKRHGRRSSKRKRA